MSRTKLIASLSILIVGMLLLLMFACTWGLRNSTNDDDTQMELGDALALVLVFLPLGLLSSASWVILGIILVIFGVVLLVGKHPEKAPKQIKACIVIQCIGVIFMGVSMFFMSAVYYFLSKPLLAMAIILDVVYCVAIVLEIIMRRKMVAAPTESAPTTVEFETLE